MTIFSFFDLSNYKIPNTVIKNDYRFFRKNVLALPEVNEVFFIGSNIVDTYMNKKAFYRHMQQVVHYYSSYKILYILHRYEDESYIKSLGKRLGFDVVRFDVILELALLKYKKKPKTISSFRSTALETLGYLYAPINLEIFKMDLSTLLKDTQIEEYKELYRHYTQKNISLIELKNNNGHIEI